MTYAEKLKDPRWQKKRLEVLQRDGFSCQVCGRKDRTLHVHHRFYISGRMPWEYMDGNFQTLCCDCHKETGEPEDHGFGHREEWEAVQTEMNCDSALLVACGIAELRNFNSKTNEQIVAGIAFWLTTKDSVDFINEFHSHVPSSEFFKKLREKRGGSHSNQTI